MSISSIISTTDWKCPHTWKSASYNTLWCLIGCSIGDLGTIYFFQVFQIHWSTAEIMLLAMLNGILTSIALESLILKITRKLRLIEAVKIAMGMSLISMISMELAMNVTDYYMTGGALITLKVLPIMWLAGFIVPLPYNYWRLKVLGKACH